MESSKFSIFNQPLGFYIPTSENLRYLFYKPIRPHLDNQFITTLFADLWGDYWGYFSFTSGYLSIGRDQLAIGDYFARVNIISIFTTLFILTLYVISYRKNKQSFLVRYINLAVIVSFVGYIVFLISYPVGNGDTIKATYIIQMFHLIVFLASIKFEKLKSENLKIYNLIIFAFLIIYIHNFQTFLSHFPATLFN